MARSHRPLRISWTAQTRHTANQQQRFNHGTYDPLVFPRTAKEIRSRCHHREDATAGNGPALRVGRRDRPLSRANKPNSTTIRQTANIVGSKSKRGKPSGAKMAESAGTALPKKSSAFRSSSHLAVSRWKSSWRPTPNNHHRGRVDPNTKRLRTNLSAWLGRVSAKRNMPAMPVAVASPTFCEHTFGLPAFGPCQRTGHLEIGFR